MEINQIRPTSPVTEAQARTVQGAAQSTQPRPILSGELTVKMAERNVLAELSRTEAVEEPTRRDDLSEAIRGVMAYEPPDMPYFV